MHRVELKAHHPLVFLSPHPLFLMHRVELKAFSKPDKFTFLVSVPNAPCGVERLDRVHKKGFAGFVPNAPCGVESCFQKRAYPLEAVEFLMHRVELKDLQLIITRRIRQSS